MSTRISETMIQFGSLDKRHFDECSKPGAWEYFTVVFPVSFPTLAKLPSVIVTPSDHGMSGFTANQMVPAVGIAVDVTPSGFTLAARNSANRGGSAGFNWMAVCETPGIRQRPVELRAGVTQPKQFTTTVKPIASMGSHSGPRDWYLTYPSFHHKETPFVTATNLYGTERRNSAVVGMAIDQHHSGFWIIGENTDTVDGECAYYYVCLADGEQGTGTNVWVETGGIHSLDLAASGNEGSWKSEEVTFTDPSITAPVVLVTAASPRFGKYRSVPALGIARYVTSHGFTLAARNTDTVSGPAWFSWVAIGCGRYCAWGTASE